MRKCQGQVHAKPVHISYLLLPPPRLLISPLFIHIPTQVGATGMRVFAVTYPEQDHQCKGFVPGGPGLLCGV